MSGSRSQNMKNTTSTMSSASKINFQYWSQSDVGRVRKNNEDNFLADTINGVFAVADGMGGHEHGELASLKAVESIKNYIHNVMAGIKAFSVDPSVERKEWVSKVIDAAIQKANAEVYRLAQEKGVQGNMGTTLSMMLFLNQELAVMGHVGDSRIYRIRNKELTQITCDQTILQEHIRQGLVDPANASNVPYANTLLQAVGYRSNVKPDVSLVDVQPGDQFLLCSDGLSNYLLNDEIVTVFSESSGPQIVPRLIDCANQRGGRDNITAIVLRMEDEEGNAAATQLDLSSGLLSNCLLLSGFSTPDMMQFLPLGSLKIFIKDEVLQTEDQSSLGLYVIMSGSVGHYKRNTWLFSSGAGGHFGEQGLFDGASASCTSVCEEEVRAILFPYKGVQQFIEKNTGVGLTLLLNLAKEQSKRERNQFGRLSQLLTTE